MGENKDIWKLANLFLNDVLPVDFNEKFESYCITNNLTSNDRLLFRSMCGDYMDYILLKSFLKLDNETSIK